MVKTIWYLDDNSEPARLADGDYQGPGWYYGTPFGELRGPYHSEQEASDGQLDYAKSL